MQGVSPLQSGINTLPFVISMVLASILNGGITAKIGYYVPSMLLCPAIMATGLGLMSTLRVGESVARWAGFEILAGAGLGLGMQASSLAAQAVLAKPDIPTGIAIMFFAQQLGGAIFTSVGQNLLSNTLAAGLAGIPGIIAVDPGQIGQIGAADILSVVPPEHQPQAREVYNHALQRIFLCGTGVACVGILAALAMEWKNVRGTGPRTPGAQQPPPKDMNEQSSPAPTLPDKDRGGSDSSALHRQQADSHLDLEKGATSANT